MIKKIFASILIISCIILSGCEYEKAISTYTEAQQANEESVRNVISRYDTPELTRSQDYENIIRRAEYLNQANNIGYLYLISPSGMILEEVQVLGKVTSLNSYITPMEESQLVSHRSINGALYRDVVVVSASDIDGTYGENVSGIFWFTPDGEYGEWNGLYRFGSERLTLTDTPIIITTQGD